MSTATTNLAGVLHQYGLLEPEQFVELDRDLVARFPDPRNLARELIQRGWLTPYQVNQIFLNKAPDLILAQHILLERLGEGGMGAVFKARHRRLGRIDAVKVIRKERLLNNDAVRRFQREAQAAARLAHPNIVSVYDAGEVNGSHFLVMQYVEGRDLSRLVKEGGPLPIAQACAYVLQAALGLQHAHEMGLVHRDIKPHNLLLTQDPASQAPSLVKVLDMGLARIEEKSTEESGPLTRTGLVMGTVDYLAPEQARNSHQVDIRADLYSLGCTLFFLLTGRVPFPGGTSVEKLLRHQFEDPPALEQLWPDIPPGLADLVRKLLAKKPDDRYRDPAELTFALAPFCSTETTPQPVEQPAGIQAGIRERDTVGPTPAEETPYSTPSVPAPHRRRLRRSRRGTWAVIIGVVCLLLGGTFLLWKRGWTSHQDPGGEGEGEPPAGQVFTLDGLDPRKIPVEERASGQPAELVHVLGTHRWRHHGPIHFLALSPDETLLASSSSSDGICLWDAHTGKRLARAQEGNLTTVAFSPDRKTLAYGISGAIVLWDIPSRKKKADLAVPGVVPTYLAFAPDGKLLASSSWLEGTVRLWDMDTLKSAGTLLHKDPIRLLAFAPDGKTLATGPAVLAWGGTGAWDPIEVVLWDVARQTKKTTLPGHKGFTSLAYSADGKRLATAGHTDRKVLVWDTTTDKTIATLAQTSTVWSVAFAPDSKTLAVSHDTGIRLWDVARGTRKLQELLAPGRSDSLLFADDGKTLFSGSQATGMIHCWDMVSGKEKDTAEGPHGLEHLALSPDGHTLAVGGLDRRVHLWDLAALAASPREKQAGPRTRLAFTGPVQELAFSGDSKILAVRAENKSQLFAVPKGDKKGAFDAIGGLALSPDGKTLAVLTETEIKRWPVAGGPGLFTLPVQFPFPAPSRRVLFAPDSRSLVAAVTNHGGRSGALVKHFDLTAGEGRTLGEFGHLSATSLALAPDGKTAAWWADESLWLWDMAAGAERHLLPLGLVRGAVFAPDSRLLAVLATNTSPADGGQSLFLIDANKGILEHRINLPRELGPGVGCAFVPDGRHLLVGYRTGVVLVLRPRSGRFPPLPPFKPREPILHWRLLGPFTLPTDGILPPPFDVQARDGALEEAEFLRKYPGLGGQEVGWREVTTRSGVVNVGSVLGPHVNAGAFGHTIIAAEEERDARLLVGSDDTLTVWLNGKQVCDFSKLRPYRVAENSVPVRLKKGENHLVVRCLNYPNEWLFSVHLAPKE